MTEELIRQIIREELAAALAVRQEKPARERETSLQEAADLCGVKLHWLRFHINAGDIKANRSISGGKWWVYPSEVRRFKLSECNQRPSRRRAA